METWHNIEDPDQGKGGKNIFGILYSVQVKAKILLNLSWKTFCTWYLNF